MVAVLKQKSSESRAEMTHRIASEIIESAAKKRAAKSERLRQARLAAERTAPAEPAAKPARRRAETSAPRRAGKAG
jgi:hypothetical protein